MSFVRRLIQVIVSCTDIENVQVISGTFFSFSSFLVHQLSRGLTTAKTNGSCVVEAISSFLSLLQSRHVAIQSTTQEDTYTSFSLPPSSSQLASASALALAGFFLLKTKERTGGWDIIITTPHPTGRRDGGGRNFISRMQPI